MFHCKIDSVFLIIANHRSRCCEGCNKPDFKVLSKCCGAQYAINNMKIKLARSGFMPSARATRSPNKCLYSELSATASEHEEHDDHAKHEEHEEHDDHAKHEEHEEKEEHAGHEGHNHDENSSDPHLWLDIENAIRITQSIAKKLATIDPENKTQYEKNATKVAEKLNLLKADISNKLQNTSKKNYIVFHDAYQYFEKQFELAVPTPVTIHPEIPLGAARIKELQSEIAEHGISCLFSEPQFSPKVIKVIAENTDAKISVLDPLGSGVKVGSSHYFEMMSNLANDFDWINVFILIFPWEEIMKKLIIALAATTMMSSAAFAEEIKIGTILGPMADSAEMAMKEVSDSGKLLDGSTVVSIRGDSTCVDSAAATAAAERLITSDKVVAIMGADCSGVTGAILQNVALREEEETIRTKANEVIDRRWCEPNTAEYNRRCNSALSGNWIEKQTKEGVSIMAFLIGENMTGGYGRGADILHDCTIGVEKGEIAVVVGPNGAGKSTAMKAVFGMLNIHTGRVMMDGEEITSLSPQARVQKGMGFVPQTSNVFTTMTVEENLEMGAFIREDDIAGTMEQVFELFPILKEKRKQPAGELSGGQAPTGSCRPCSDDTTQSLDVG
ncbi:High-affinity zinc uptake system protein ZnuA [Nymphon striatum]|nr:High-affinity zinc uptake system protein ZnuA [Nymphon striatum]